MLQARHTSATIPAVSLSAIMLGSLALQAEKAGGDIGSNAPFLRCQGNEVTSPAHWGAAKNLVDSWMDLDLWHARVIRKVLWAIQHNGLLEESAMDCGFGLAVVILVSLRAVEYDDGPAEARSLYRHLEGLLERLEPHRTSATLEGWGFDLTDLKIYPNLLGFDPPHRCYGTKLRIFVYTIADMTRGVLHCQAGQWGLEALVPHWLRKGSCLTDNADEADFFFVPWHTWCDRMVYRLNETRRDISNRYISLMRRRDKLLPHWSRNAGRDHVFLFSDQGMNFFPEWRDYIPHSVFLMTEALTPECGPSCFNPWKDVVLPGHVDFFRYRRMRVWNKPSEERTLLLNFHGRHPGVHEFYRNNIVRGRIVEKFADKPGVSVGGFVDDYFEIMGNSHFCLVPMGTSSWTNHLYEAFFAGCIPVILSDDFEVPFQELLDWPSFSIKWPMTDIGPNLHRYLLSVPIEILRRMKAAVDAHVCWFDFHQVLEPIGQDCSPYLGLVRALEQKRGMLYKSRTGPFWGHAD